MTSDGPAVPGADPDTVRRLLDAVLAQQESIRLLVQALGESRPGGVPGAAPPDAAQPTGGPAASPPAKPAEQPPAGQPAEKPAGKSDKEAGAQRPVNWATLSGPERFATWQELAIFVESIVDRYKMQGQITACWWQHLDAVELLTALWHVWQDAYGEKGALKSAMSWQDTLIKTRDRLAGIFVSCRNGHVESPVRGWMDDQVRQEFYEAVLADTTGPGTP
ncbi:MAG TPA: hypothetical protein VGN37_08570 [Actinocatenispora sp.]